MKAICSILLMLLVVQWTRAETVAVIDDFSVDKNQPLWSVADKAAIKFENQSIRITYPKYTPSDPAMWPRATRNVEAFDFTRFNGLRIDIENPTKENQFLQLSFRDVGGSQGQLAYRFSPGQRRVVTVRFDEARPSGNIDWSGVQLLDFMRTQPPADMTWIVRRIELFADRPDSTIQNELLALYKKAVAALSQAKSAKLLPAEQLDALTASTQKWGDKLNQPLGVFGKMEQCRADLTNVFGQVKAITLRQQAKDPILLWSVPLGTTFRPDEALLQYQTAAKELQVFTAAGQYEDTIVRLTNLSESPQQVKLGVSGGDESLKQAMSIRENVPVRAEDGSTVGDALMPVDPEGIKIAPSATAEIWLRVDTKHHTLQSGKHTASLDVTTSAGGVVHLPVVVQVWNFNLAIVPQQFKAQAWAEMFAGRSFVVKNHLPEARNNLIDYGVNVFNLGPEEIPWPKLNASGELASPIDYKLHDERLAFIRGKDKPFILYFMNLDDNNAANWSLRSDLTTGSDAWKRGLKTWLAQWTQHLEQLGLSTADYALYLTDEPGPEELDRYRQVGRIIREINPKIRIYINSADLYYDDAKDNELMTVTDIWQPDETVGFAADPKLLPTLKKHAGKDLWVYACRTGMRSRSANAHDYYRLMSWRAMRDGLTGIGYWSYCAAMENEDLWDGTKVRGSGAVLVYSNDKGIIPSARWELIRQSIDDTKYVQLLQKNARETKSGELRSKIDSLTTSRLNEVIEQRDNPAAVVQWRRDAGELIDSATKNLN